MKVWDKISSLVSEQGETNKQRTQVTAKPAKPTTAPTADPLAAAAEVAFSILPEGEALEAIAAGQVQLLNLEAVRAALGPRWPKLAMQVNMIVEAILRKMLGPADVFTRVQESEYVVIFPTMKESQARVLMRSAAQQIHQKLFGVDPAFAAIAVSSMVTTVDRKAIESAPTQIDGIRDALRAAEAAEKNAGTTGAGTDAGQFATPIQPGAISAGRLVPLDHRSSRAAGDTASAIVNSLNNLQDANRDAKAQWSVRPTGVDISGGGKQTAGEAKADTTAKGSSASVKPAAPPPAIGELKLTYRPIWDVGKQSVTAYRLQVSIDVDGAAMDLSEFCLTYDDLKVLQAVNSLVIRRVVNEVLNLQSDSKTALIFAPISRQFISSENGLRYLLDDSQRISPAMQSRLIWEIADAYYGSWQALAPKVAIMRRCCKAVGIRLSLDHRDFEGITATGAAFVSGRVSDHNWPERQALTEINRFAEASSKAGVKSIIDGLETRSLVIAAIGAGVDLVSGSAIGADRPSPAGVYALTTEDVFLQRHRPKP